MTTTTHTNNDKRVLRPCGRQTLALLALLSVAAIVRAQPLPLDSVRMLDEVVISSLYGGVMQQKVQAPVVSEFKLKQIEQEHVQSIKELSALVPNFYIPDYGSRMTSSMYVRGLGARIDNPVMGLYVDGIPYFNKNNFDFDFCDIRSVKVLRGPQGTLFGRNTMGGVIDINTLSPYFFQGSRVRMEAGGGDTYGAQYSLYRLTGDSLGLSASAFYRYQNGFYTNEYDGSDCDRSQTGGLRLRLQKRVSPRLSVDNSLGLNVVEQGGYPYRRINEATGRLLPIAYNDECGYRRLNVNDGLALKWELPHDRQLTLVTAYQYTHDNMRLDQDFTPRSMFTLKQVQDEQVLSQELILRRSPRNRRWSSLWGTMLYGRLLKMQAPVTFKQDGIDQLILKNANEKMAAYLPGKQLLLREGSFVIGDDFKTHELGFALYRNVTGTLGRFTLEWGQRIELEQKWFSYNSGAQVHYYVLPDIAQEAARPIDSRLAGSDRQFVLEWLPRLALSYRHGAWRSYASVARGYKSGGFNTQLFSDLLQNRMMNDMMQAMGIALATAEGQPTMQVSDVIKYKPEHSLNFEVGTQYSGSALRGELTLFYLSCTNQQLTVFPQGTSTGRMMTNAGRTESYGVESSLGYTADRFSLYANYGYTHATFKRYRSGSDNYAGKFVPYMPLHTLSAGGEYHTPLRGGLFFDQLTLSAGWRGIGPIYWDEQNAHRQNFYSLLNGSVRLSRGHGSVELWCQNLTDTHYSVFYFVSVKNAFMQQGKPCRVGLTLQCEF